MGVTLAELTGVPSAVTPAKLFSSGDSLLSSLGMVALLSQCEVQLCESSWAHTRLWQPQARCDIHAASSRVGLKADTQSSELLMFKGPAKGLWVSWSSVSDNPEHVSLAAELQTLCGTCVSNVVGRRVPFWGQAQVEESCPLRSRELGTEQDMGCSSDGTGLCAPAMELQPNCLVPSQSTAAPRPSSRVAVLGITHT